MLLDRSQHWGVRLDAARRLAAFDPAPELVDALARGVRADDYLVRYHSATTLTRWAGGDAEVSDDEDLFSLVVDEAGPAGHARAADVLVARVGEHLGW